MRQNLKQDGSNLESLLENALHVSTEYLDSVDTRPPATAFSQKEMLTLPEDGLASARTLGLFLERYGRDIPSSNGPRFWGLVTGGTTPAALMGDWLTSVYDLNLSHAANSVAPNIEMEAIHMLRQLFGLPENFSGTFVSGATMSNFSGLAMAREWVGRQFGKNISQEGLHVIPQIKVLSSEAHSSSLKALAMLGIGRENMKIIPKLSGNREAMDVSALRTALLELSGEPCIVIANAGTVNTVDFDDLQSISALKSGFKFWLHMDAAFGGFASCSPKYRHLLNGMQDADSITIDAHKWLNVPYDSAMIFTRHRDLQISVFQNSGAYLGEIAEPVDFIHLSPENSRRMRALPAWFSLTAYGRAGYQDIMERNCLMAQKLGERINASGAFCLLAPVRMNVVCFTLNGDINAERVKTFLMRLRDDGRVFMTPTTYNGVPAIRAAFSNWRTEEKDLEIAWQAMAECL
ncbi:MAG: aspartate aminotransferase family protein [Chloroflexi bacterium]|nr:aspartate aminotransferase family protein [Chloroflexota bacterium]